MLLAQGVLGLAAAPGPPLLRRPKRGMERSVPIAPRACDVPLACAVSPQSNAPERANRAPSIPAMRSI